MNTTALLGLATTWLLTCSALVAAQEVTRSRGSDAAPDGAPLEQDVAAARDGADRMLDFLTQSQKPNGQWGLNVLDGPVELGYSIETYYCWNLAANALAMLALMEAPASDERDAALRRGMEWFLSARMPKRGSNWDNDQAWPLLYGTVAMIRALDHPVSRASSGESESLATAIEARGREMVRALLAQQSPLGGWAYYDNPPYTRRPTWATSFCTALVLPSLTQALEYGWPVDEASVLRARRYVERCRLPSGAYEYDLRPVPRASGGENINRVQGSLSRIQVCNWALHRTRSEVVDHAAIRRGLDQFLEDHRFLDVARMRPVPHEAYYANAGYFYFFGHYYAALAIEQLPEDEREAWHRRLRPHVTKAIRKNGSTSDFLASEYTVIAGTAFGALTLLHGLRD